MCGAHIPARGDGCSRDQSRNLASIDAGKELQCDTVMRAFGDGCVDYDIGIKKNAHATGGGRREKAGRSTLSVSVSGSRRLSLAGVGRTYGGRTRALSFIPQDHALRVFLSGVFAPSRGVFIMGDGGGRLPKGFLERPYPRR